MRRMRRGKPKVGRLNGQNSLGRSSNYLAHHSHALPSSLRDGLIFFRPFVAHPHSSGNPWLAPWAAFLRRFAASLYGHGYGVGGVGGMPGITVFGVPGEVSDAGMPGMIVSGVPGVPGV